MELTSDFLVDQNLFKSIMNTNANNTKESTNQKQTEELTQFNQKIKNIEKIRFYLSQFENKHWIVKPIKIDHIFRFIMKILIEYKEEKSNRFTNFTFTNEEISIIISEEQKEKLFADFQGQFMGSSDGPYHVVSIDTANPGIDEAGILAEITNKFAKYEIPIICNSTYMRNYLLYRCSHQKQFETLIKNESEYCLE